MIINKIAPYWEPDEKQKQAEIQAGIATIIERIRDLPDKTDNQAEFDEMSKLQAEGKRLRDTVLARYESSHNTKAILADIAEIINAIEKSDYKDRVKEYADMLGILQSHGAKEQTLSTLRELAVETFDNCCSFISQHITDQLAILENRADWDSIGIALASIEKRVSLWYVKPHPAYIPMAHGRATDAIAYMSSRNASIDRITGNATIEKLGVQLVIMKLSELQSTLGISTDKLLSYALATFTQQNDFRHTAELRRDVTIPLREYAQLLGYDVNEHATSTPEEAEREKKRAKIQLDNARKAIKKDLLLLQASTLRWEESIKGKPRDFDSVSIVTRVSIHGGDIKIYFTPEIALYLAERDLFTYYPVSLLKTDNRDRTSYTIGRKLAEHYYIDNNQIRGTSNIIGVPFLLAVTDLPSFDSVQETDRGHWENRIKEPFEKALDTLLSNGTLKDWKYTHAKGVELTDEEAYNITRYEDFSKLYIQFTLADTVDSTERIEAKQKARAEAKAKRKTAKKKSK